LTSYGNLLPKLRVSGVTSLLPHTPFWFGQSLIYLFTRESVKLHHLTAANIELIPELWRQSVYASHEFPNLLVEAYVLLAVPRVKHSA